MYVENLKLSVYDMFQYKLCALFNKCYSIVEVKRKKIDILKPCIDSDLINTYEMKT